MFTLSIQAIITAMNWATGPMSIFLLVGDDDDEAHIWPNDKHRVYERAVLLCLVIFIRIER